MKSSFAVAAAASLAMLCLAAPAHAGGTVRGAIGTGSFELDEKSGFDADADTTVFDFRGAFDVSEHVFLRGEYTSASADELDVEGTDFDIDTDISALRLGAGYGANVGGVRLYGVAEFVQLEIEVDGEGEDGNGYGLTGGIADQGKGKLLWSVELSFLDVEETAGATLDATVGYRFTPSLAGVVGLQSYALEDSDENELSLGALYLGLEARF